MPSDDHSSDGFEVIDRNEASLDPDAIARIRTWLQPTDYEAASSEFHRHRASQAPGTGLWICQTARYREWHDSDEHASLWIKGVPGAGKSVTAAAIAAHLAATEAVPVLTFFFRYIVVANRTPRGLVQDWLAQLLPSSLRLQATLAPLVASALDDTTDAQLWQYLQVGLADVDRAYCIVDALDEMDLTANHRFLERLNDLAKFRPGAIKVLMTSRPTQYLQSRLPSTAIVHISLEKDRVGRDIATYVARRLDEAWPDPATASLRQEVARAMLERCDGLFLYARLLLDQIIPALGSATLFDAKDVVGSLPVGLEDMYNDMLRRQAHAVGVDTDRQKFLLEMVTHAARPLRLNELAQALVGSFPDIGTSRAKEVARTACSPLLEILEDETVQVIHHSLTEFLLDDGRRGQLSQTANRQFPAIVPAQAHRQLCITCVQYLQSSLQSSLIRPEERFASDVDDGAVEEVDTMKDEKANDRATALAFDFQHAKLQFPLLEYAVHHWAYHAGHYDVVDESFFDILTTFLQPTNDAFYRWLMVGWERSRPNADVPSIIHVAAFAGLTQLAKTLDLAHCVNAIDGGDRTPLFWASRRGHTEIATLLLENGAAPLAENFDGLQPIHEAAKRNHPDVAKLLLHAGASPVARKSHQGYGWRPSGGESVSKGDTPLQYVCAAGHLETLSVMIPFLDSASLDEALCRCCRAGRRECVRALLTQSDMSPDARWRHGTALALAVRSLDVGCVALLLDRGADVHAFSAFDAPITILGPTAPGEHAAPPLHKLFAIWHVEKLGACRAIFALLLRAGATTDSQDADGRAPLLEPYSDHRLAQDHLHRTAIQALLDAGTRFRDTDGDGIICRCVEATRDVAVLQMLLDHGYRLSHRGRDGTTALHAAFRDGSQGYATPQPSTDEDVISFLLEHGLGPAVTNGAGQTALEAAAGSNHRHRPIFRRLFESCSDMKAREKCIWALEYDRDPDAIDSFLDLLLPAGVSLEARNAAGQTPVLARIGHAEVCDALIAHGARVDAVDPAGRGLLHHYVALFGNRNESPMPRLHKLLALGLDIAGCDAHQNSLFHELAAVWNPHARYGADGQIELARFLMAQGLDPNARNARGQTVIHAYLDKRNGSPMGDWAGLSTVLRVLRESPTFDIDARDGRGHTALQVTAGHHEWAFFHLLEVGADPLLRTSDDRTVLHIAARAGKANIVGHILGVAAELLEATDRLGRTALHDACADARREVVYLLLQRGASVSHTDTLGRTALHACAEAEDRSAPTGGTRDFHGGDGRSDDARPPPPRPTNSPPWYRTDHLVSRNATQARSSRVAAIVGMLIDAHVDVKTEDIHQYTPLDLALDRGCVAMARALAARFDIGDVTDGDQEHQARVTAELALRCRPTLALEELPLPVRQEVLAHPQRYVASLDDRDLTYLLSTGGRSGFATTALLQRLAKGGRIDQMRVLGSIAKEFDDQEDVMVRVCVQSTEHVYWDKYNPPLVAACERADPNMAMLKLLVETHGLDVNARAYVGDHLRTPDAKPLLGGTALHRLAEAHSWWQLDAIRYLVEHGARIDARNEFGQTPLHVACGVDSSHDSWSNTWKPCMWKADCVRLLLALGADVDAVDDDGATALYQAGPDATAVRILLAHGASVTAGASPFFAAIAARNAAGVRILLDAGVGPDAVDVQRSTDLHDAVGTHLTRSALLCACFPGHRHHRDPDAVGIVQLLVARGAALYAPVSADDTLLHYIVQHAAYGIVAAVLASADRIDFDARDPRGRTVFVAACNGWQTLPAHEPAPIHLALQANPDIDLRAVDADDKTVLHHLADNPDQEEPAVLAFLQHPVCKELLHRRDRHGFTPIQYALRTLRPAVVAALLDLGADLLAADPTGATAAHHIARQYLRGYQPQRADYVSRAEDGGFPDACAALWRQYRARGGDLEARDGQGNTPLLAFVASAAVDRARCDRDRARCCHVAYYDTLFADADAHARNDAGESALHVIAGRDASHRNTSEHDAALFAFMVAKGLAPLAEDARGRSALDVAAACGHTSILELYQYRS